MYHIIGGFYSNIPTRVNLKPFIMKSMTLILCACILFCLNSYAQDFKKLNVSEVESKKVQIANKFANDYLSQLKNGSFYQFKDEAIDGIKNAFTEDTQKAMYQYVKGLYGDYQSLEYAETWIQSGNPTIKIFRFKGDFEKSNKKLEIRVVLNESDKIVGFFIIPWSDMLK
jgi:hypothetical protein